jgi:hypothetical protein
MEKIRGKQGVNGFHIMTLKWEEIIPRLVQEAGLIREKTARLAGITGSANLQSASLKPGRVKGLVE